MFVKQNLLKKTNQNISYSLHTKKNLFKKTNFERNIELSCFNSGIGGNDLTLGGVQFLNC